MRIRLVLEGGAMRGMYTAGVLDVFLDNQIEVDGIVGASANDIPANVVAAGNPCKVIKDI